MPSSDHNIFTLLLGTFGAERSQVEHLEECSAVKIWILEHHDGSLQEDFVLAYLLNQTFTHTTLIRVHQDIQVRIKFTPYTNKIMTS